MKPNSFVVRKVVRFSHCDPAGIIYYPRYFDILHETKEDWFREALALPFRRFIGEMRQGFPIVKLDAEFAAPSRLGEDLDVELSVARIGGASLGIDYGCTCGAQLRMRARTTVVHVDLDRGSALPIEGELRARIEAFVDGRAPAGSGG